MPEEKVEEETFEDEIKGFYTRPEKGSSAKDPVSMILKWRGNGGKMYTTIGFVVRQTEQEIILSRSYNFDSDSYTGPRIKIRYNEVIAAYAMTSWVNWSEHRLEAMKALKTLDDILEEEKIPSWDLKDRVKFAQGVIMKLTQENNRLASVTQKKEYITLRLPKKEES